MPVMPMMPMTIPGITEANGSAGNSTTGKGPRAAKADGVEPSTSPQAVPSITINMPDRSDSMSLVRTDAPEDEIVRDRVKRAGGGGVSFSSVANASLAAMAWRKQTAHQQDLEVGFYFLNILSRINVIMISRAYREY